MVRIKALWNRLGSMQGVVLFVVVLVAAHFFWKLTVTGDVSGDKVLFLNWLDITPVFDFMTAHLTHVVNWVLRLFGVETTIEGTRLVHPNGALCGIVWGCSGLKQGFIFVMIILFSKGRLWNRLLYIIAGLTVVYLFNVLRLAILVMLVRDHVEYFDFVHGYLLKYLFYFIIFLMWAIWDYRFSGRSKKSAH